MTTSYEQPPTHRPAAPQTSTSRGRPLMLATITLLAALAVGGAWSIAVASPTLLGVAGSIPKLDEDAHEVFHGSEADAIPDERERSATFWAGNENHLYVFEQDVRELGGGYVGVGADQNYIFIGWQRPELVWLTDYDERIQIVHMIYRAFFLHADDGGEMLDLWEEDGEGMEVLKKAYGKDAIWEDVQEAFEKGSPYILRRLRRVKREAKKSGIANYLTDDEQYAFIVEMWKAERIRPMLGNLLDDKALVGVGRVARELDVPIRAIYLSNAEQYWDYPEQFRVNFRALHFDEKSLVLRTHATGNGNDDYRFNVHPARDFVAWLDGGVKSARKIDRDDDERMGRPFGYSTPWNSGDPAGDDTSDANADADADSGAPEGQ